MGFLLHVKYVGAKPPFELADKNFAVFAQAQVDDALAVQRQGCAHELGQPLFAERVFDDAELAAQGDFFGPGGAANGGGRAKGGELHKVWRFVHGSVVRVQEVVVVVGHDGVFDTITFDQGGALGALDVQSVYSHVIARLLHVYALQLGRRWAAWASRMMVKLPRPLL